MLRLLGAVELNSGSSERRRREPKCWLNFNDVIDCRDIESLNAFIRQFLSEQGLVGEIRARTYWALVYAWRDGISSYR